MCDLLLLMVRKLWPQFSGSGCWLIEVFLQELFLGIKLYWQHCLLCFSAFPSLLDGALRLRVSCTALSLPPPLPKEALSLACGPRGLTNFPPERQSAYYQPQMMRFVGFDRIEVVHGAAESLESWSPRIGPALAAVHVKIHREVVFTWETHEVAGIKACLARRGPVLMTYGRHIVLPGALKTMPWHHSNLRDTDTSCDVCLTRPSVWRVKALKFISLTSSRQLCESEKGVSSSWWGTRRNGWPAEVQC